MGWDLQIAAIRGFAKRQNLSQVLLQLPNLRLNVVSD